MAPSEQNFYFSKKVVAIKAEIGDLGWNIWQHANIHENVVRKMCDSSMEGLPLGLWFINTHTVTDTEVKRKYNAIPTKAGSREGKEKR